MCSLGDDNLDLEDQEQDKYLPKRITFDPAQNKDNKCNKCREAPSCVLLRGKDAYCKTCFLTGTVHKFKALLGKNRFIRPNEKVLVLHGSGHSNTALLHFLRTGLDLTAAKKLRFQPIFIYIDDNFNFDSDNRKKFVSNLKEQVESCNFEFHFASLNQIVELHKNRMNKELSFDEYDFPNYKLEEIFTGLNETNRKELTRTYIREILIQAAKQFQCKHVFTPELGIDIASGLLTSVSLGRGMHLSYDVGVADVTTPEVTIIRPLRVFDLKELALYNHFNDLKVVTNPMQLETGLYKSVQNLMQNFVSNLQNNFPATITTIVRTGDKLGVDKKLENNPRCRLCKVPKELPVDELTSSESTRFSHWVSTHQTPNDYESVLKSFNEDKVSEFCFSCKKCMI